MKALTYIILLILLTCTNCPLLSQDTSKIEVIIHNDKVGLFLDSIQSNKIAHKLEEGRLSKKELELCDSALSVSDSVNTNLYKVIDNFNIELQNRDIEKELLNDKIKVVEAQRLVARKQRWVWAGAGVIFGTLIGLFL